MLAIIRLGFVSSSQLAKAILTYIKVSGVFFNKMRRVKIIPALLIPHKYALKIE